MYPFTLDIVELLTVRNAKLAAQFERAKANTLPEDPFGPNIRRLYHGTSAAAAKEIIAEGFQLPTGAGMFGRGIYFADTPLKSWQYSSKTGWDWILVCDVILGRQKQMTQ